MNIPGKQLRLPQVKYEHVQTGLWKLSTFPTVTCQGVSEAEEQPLPHHFCCPFLVALYSWSPFPFLALGRVKRHMHRVHVIGTDFCLKAPKPKATIFSLKGRCRETLLVYKLCPSKTNHWGWTEVLVKEGSMLLTSQSLSCETFTEKRDLFSANTGQAANSVCAVFNSLRPWPVLTGLQAAPHQGCGSVPDLPGTCSSSAQACWELAVSAWSQLSKSSSLCAKKPQLQWLLSL